MNFVYKYQCPGFISGDCWRNLHYCSNSEFKFIDTCKNGNVVLKRSDIFVLDIFTAGIFLSHLVRSDSSLLKEVLEFNLFNILDSIILQNAIYNYPDSSRTNNFDSNKFACFSVVLKNHKIILFDANLDFFNKHISERRLSVKTKSNRIKLGIIMPQNDEFIKYFPQSFIKPNG